MQGDEIETHLDKMAKVFERLNSLSNPDCPLNQDNFYSTAIFTSLPAEWMPCVLGLMNKPFLGT